MMNYVKNFIKAYEKHFKNPYRNDATLENVRYAGWLITRYAPELTKQDLTIAELYNKCKSLV